MSVSVARVPTASASRYLQQLAKHWSHKFAVVYTPGQATVPFSNGSCLELRADSETLDVELTVVEGEDAARMRQVVEDHLNRFAFREGPLTFDWK